MLRWSDVTFCGVFHMMHHTCYVLSKLFSLSVYLQGGRQTSLEVAVNDCPFLT